MISNNISEARDLIQAVLLLVLKAESLTKCHAENKLFPARSGAIGHSRFRSKPLKAKDKMST